MDRNRLDAARHRSGHLPGGCHMKPLGLFVIGLVLLAAAVRAEEADQWKVVCDHDGLTAESRCYLSFFTEDKALGTWLGIAVQRLNGWNEIQVPAAGSGSLVAPSRRGPASRCIQHSVRAGLPPRPP